MGPTPQSTHVGPYSYNRDDITVISPLFDLVAPKLADSRLTTTRFSWTLSEVDAA